MKIQWNTLWSGAKGKAGEIEISESPTMDLLAEAIGKQANLQPTERLVAEFRNMKGAMRDIRIARLKEDEDGRGIPSDWHYYW